MADEGGINTDARNAGQEHFRKTHSKVKENRNASTGASCRVIDGRRRECLLAPWALLASVQVLAAREPRSCYSAAPLSAPCNPSRLDCPPRNPPLLAGRWSP